MDANTMGWGWGGDAATAATAVSSLVAQFPQGSQQWTLSDHILLLLLLHIAPSLLCLRLSAVTLSQLHNSTPSSKVGHTRPESRTVAQL